MGQKGKHRLTDREVRNAKTPGRLHDGEGLYLEVSAGAPETPGGPPGVRKRWFLLYTPPEGGKRREMGLGSIASVSLKAAREAADKARADLGAGIDPLVARDKERKEKARARARQLTFKQAAETFIASESAGWKNPKHEKLWRASLEEYAFPVIGSLSVADVDTQAVLRVIEPIWKTKNETASRVRGRIEAILDWAAVRGYRSADNPARWRGFLSKALPKRSKVRPVKHHPSLPFRDVGKFMADLREQDGLGALALELTVLTAVRTNEALGARWSEFDLKEKVWSIPKERMKMERPHRVPLSTQAMALLERIKDAGSKTWLFPGLGTNKPLSNMAMLKVLERMKRDSITVHGFRATFKTWGEDATDFPREVIEAALAHAIGSAAEQSYRRGDQLAKRRELLQAWANYCDRIPDESGGVIEFKTRESSA